MHHEHVPLSQQFPGLEHLSGVPSFDLLGLPLTRELGKTGEPSWASLAALTPAELLAVKGVGPGRTSSILRELERLTSGLAIGQPGAGANDPSPAAETVSRALNTIAAWAAGTGRGGDVLTAILSAHSSEDADRPAEALAALSAIDVSQVANPAEVARFDPVLLGEQFLASFDERQQAILERVLDLDGSAPTLEEIGRQFEVTRERIRQIEVKVRNRLDALAADPNSMALRAAAQQLRQRLGAAVPLASIIDEFATFPPDHLDRLLLHLAGPYHLRDGWLGLDDLGPVPTAVLSAFEEVATEGWVALDALLDAVAQLGIRDEFRSAALDACPSLRVIEDAVIDWRGSVGAKARRLLAWRHAPLHIDELHDAIGQDRRTLINGLAADPQIVCVGVGRHALATWEVTGYQGIVNEMASRLGDAAEPVPLELLAQELSEEFGASPQSVRTYARTHPAFITVGSKVSLRPADQPYQPKTSLEDTAGCFLVDGSWAWRTKVDHDILRGSGRGLPEAFAVHLGLDPLSKTAIDSPVGPIRLGWGQSPQIGSLRLAARSVDAEEGDWLFVVRQTPSLIGFRRVPALAADTPAEEQVRALIGDRSRRPLLRVLADAIGLSADRSVDADSVIGALRRRGDANLADLAQAGLTG